MESFGDLIRAKKKSAVKYVENIQNGIRLKLVFALNSSLLSIASKR